MWKFQEAQKLILEFFSQPTNGLFEYLVILLLIGFRCKMFVMLGDLRKLYQWAHFRVSVWNLKLEWSTKLKNKQDWNKLSFSVYLWVIYAYSNKLKAKIFLFTKKNFINHYLFCYILCLCPYLVASSYFNFQVILHYRQRKN